MAASGLAVGAALGNTRTNVGSAEKSKASSEQDLKPNSSNVGRLVRHVDCRKGLPHAFRLQHLGNSLDES
jgi:hypothetical protein